MKWGDKYGPIYVNRLYSMVARNLSLPFRFICLTDDSDGLVPDIESFPIPEVGANMDDPEGLKRVQAWKKLTTLQNPLYDISGTCLFLDLDILIVDRIDCFFDPDGEFFIIHEWDTDETVGNSSVYRFESGTLEEVLNHFVAHRDQIVSTFANEQLYLSRKVEEMGLLNFWPNTWCPSYRKHCLPHNRIKRWFSPGRKPEGARIIIFHGAPDPEDAIAGKGDRLYRRLAPTPWIADYWR